VLEVDYAKKVYRKLTIDNTVFRLTDLPYHVKAVSTPTARRHITILAWTSAPIARTIHVDDVKMGRVP
jgi:hypothetical protein